MPLVQDVAQPFALASTGELIVSDASQHLLVLSAVDGTSRRGWTLPPRRSGQVARPAGGFVVCDRFVDVYGELEVVDVAERRVVSRIPLELGVEDKIFPDDAVASAVSPSGERLALVGIAGSAKGRVEIYALPP